MALVGQFERNDDMEVLTRSASEEIVIDKPVRLIVLKTAPDEVRFGLFDRREEVCNREPVATLRKTVTVIGPFGENIEIDD